MGRLTTHVLDTARGIPGRGVRIEVYRDGERETPLASAETGADGRCPAPLLEGEALRPGRYEMIFHAGRYFRAAGFSLPDPPFVDEVSVRFGVADADGHYHVPLLVSPWSYTTYRGS